MLKVVDDESDPNATSESAATSSLLDEIVRDGARQMLAAALQAEVSAYIEAFADEVDENGHRLVVRNGYHEPREVTTAAGAVPVKQPRVNDKRVDPVTGERKRFASAILPAWARKSPRVAEVLPLLYLHGLSSSDFGPALEQFLGTSNGLSAATITRLTKDWQDEAAAFNKRSLAETDFVYVWVDGIHLKVRLTQDKVCLLVIVGVRADGSKELVRPRRRAPRIRRVLARPAPGLQAPRIGYEVIDPPLYTGNPYGSTSLACNSGSKCRLSDVGFGRFDDGYTSTPRGYIARPSSTGTTTWNGTAKYRATATATPSGGVRAVGRTSGMSTGTITHSCIKVNVADHPGVMQVCQYVGTYSSDPGDSGGPVFKVTNSPSANDVTFVGLNWGEGRIDGQDIGVLSSWPNTLREFSPYDVRVCAAGFSC